MGRLPSPSPRSSIHSPVQRTTTLKMAFRLLLFGILLSAITQVLSSSLYGALSHLQLNGRADEKKDERAWKPPKPNGNLSLAQLPDARPKTAERKFSSKLVEDEISRISARIGDEALKRIFINCYPNSLDTTVDWFDLDLDEPDHAKAFPRSFWITGDIEASWLRDSASQLKPYLPLLERLPTDVEEQTEWNRLYRLALGLVYMQSQMVITAPYANSFTPPKSAKLNAPANDIMNQNFADSDWYFPAPPTHQSHYVPKGFQNVTTPDVDTDGTGVWEMKWEVDSLANFLGLAPALAKHSGRADFVGSKLWRRATRLALDTLIAQQRSTADQRVAFDTGRSEEAEKLNIERRDDETTDWQKRFEGRGGGVYRFQRLDRSPTETRSDKGFGEPGLYTGLVKSAFRPSDDATIFPFLVPSNAQLAASLAALLPVINNSTKATQDTSPTSLAAIAGLASKLESDVRGAIQEHAVLPRKGVDGDQLAFEVDGYGSASFMDDANVPSLLSLPYLGFMDASDPLYVRTRATLFSPKNKWWFNGTAGHGIGGPHVGSDYAWPMSRIVQILTTEDEAEQRDALAFLRSTTAGTGLMHESVNVNNATDFTRAWFGWANGLFGEAIRHVEGGANAALLNATYA